MALLFVIYIKYGKIETLYNVLMCTKSLENPHKVELTLSFSVSKQRFVLVLCILDYITVYMGFYFLTTQCV